MAKEKDSRVDTAAHADVTQLIKRKKKRRKAVVSLDIIGNVSNLDINKQKKNNAQMYGKQDTEASILTDHSVSFSHKRT